MTTRSLKKFVHLASTIWFVAAVGYLLILALQQAGVHWLLVVSLSGQGVLLIFLLVSLYLFAIFRGVRSDQAVLIEHPLTTTSHYSYFYTTTPFLGGLAGFLGTLGASTLREYSAGVALGTLGTTFVVWVVVDPLLGVLETLLSSTARNHRNDRLGRAKIEAVERKQRRERLLAEVISREEQCARDWCQQLTPQAQRLAELLVTDQADTAGIEREVIGIGARAWQMGGIACMRLLREMAMDLARKAEAEAPPDVVDYISFWWDGIGSWRKPAIDEIAAV
jgi:hypothetical protein